MASRFHTRLARPKMTHSALPMKSDHVARPWHDLSTKLIRPSRLSPRQNRLTWHDPCIGIRSQDRIAHVTPPAARAIISTEGNDEAQPHPQAHLQPQEQQPQPPNERAHMSAKESEKQTKVGNAGSHERQGNQGNQETTQARTTRKPLSQGNQETRKRRQPGDKETTMGKNCGRRCQAT